MLTPPCCRYKGGLETEAPRDSCQIAGLRFDPKQITEEQEEVVAWGRMGSHCGRSTAGRSGGEWCRRWSRGPSPGRRAAAAGAERAASPQAPSPAQGAAGAEWGIVTRPARGPLCCLCPRPRGLPVDARACPHGLLTTFLISEACTEGLQGKMTVFSSALRSASNVRLPWIRCPASEGHQGPLPLPLCPPGV